ncbi:MAG: hypothetical protein L6Q98_08630 [Anaerolineae bacterium]|nr:hypothetical protein [Anaerolineae bacterium]NUQ05008.1 hypothetical protein [Anaerolineae bacterium]
MTSQVKIAEEKRRRWALPVVGLILILALSVIAYFLAPYVQETISDLFPAFRRDGMSRQTYQLVVAGFTLGVLLLVATLAVSLGGRRKRPLDVKNTTLEKERAAMIAGKKAMKKRQRRLNQEMRDYIRKNQK